MSELLYLSRADVEHVGLDMSDVIRAVEAAYGQKGLGRTECPPKLGIHPGGPDDFIQAMPGSVPELGAAGVKWVSSYPGNRGRSLPLVTGLIVLNDPDTGVPLAVMDATWVTAMRTGAVTAVAARLLARPESSTVGVLGCGVQGRSNVRSLAEVFAIREVRGWDPAPEAAAFADKVGSRLGIKACAVDAPRDAVSGCDIVVTAAPMARPGRNTIGPGWLDKGTCLVMVDYGSSVDPGALDEVAKFCTDDRVQLSAAASAGYFRRIPPVYADLGELVAGLRPGREDAEERTAIAHLGLAICDVAAGMAVYREALRRDIGTRLPL